MNITKTLWVILLSGLFATVISVNAQPDQTSILELIGEMVEKPEHHQKIAEQYKIMADNARSEAEKHEKMRKTYHNHAQFKGLGAGSSMERHCEQLVQLNQSLAKEYDALAELHQSEAIQE